MVTIILETDYETEEELLRSYFFGIIHSALMNKRCISFKIAEEGEKDDELGEI